MKMSDSLLRGWLLIGAFALVLAGVLWVRRIFAPQPEPPAGVTEMTVLPASERSSSAATEGAAADTATDKGKAAAGNKGESTDKSKNKSKYKSKSKNKSKSRGKKSVKPRKKKEKKSPESAKEPYSRDYLDVL